MDSVVLVTASWLFVPVAYLDLTVRRIPNELSLALGALGLLRLVVAADLSAALWTIGTTAAVFAASFVLFSRGFIGGGDAKLVSAVALLVGYPLVSGFLVAMSLCGLVLSLIVLAHDRIQRMLLRSGAGSGLPNGASVPPEAPRQPTVPYGVAIAFAALWVLFQQTQIG